MELLVDCPCGCGRKLDKQEAKAFWNISVSHTTLNYKKVEVPKPFYNRKERRKRGW